jgi:predicted dehydrogenase
LTWHVSTVEPEREYLLVQKVVIIGIGMAGTVHARALEGVPGVALIAGIDTRSRSLLFRGDEIPIYRSVFDMWSEKKLHPDLIVVATPTPTHAQVCSEVTEHYQYVSIIVEKPAADNLEDAQRIICDIGDKQPVSVAYHMAFSPVVEWALREVAERAGELGPPIAIESWGTDPYQSELASAQARLGNSWIDSGINALSVIERFVRPIECTSLRQIGISSQSVFEGTFICESGGHRLSATILTSWYSTAPSRWIRIRYSSGAELVMDHNAVAGYLRQNGEVCAVFGSDGTTPRREAHYRALYKSWLAEQDQIFSTATSVRLHALLFAKGS